MVNKYAVAYCVAGEIYYKKFVFVLESIQKENLMYNAIMGAKVAVSS